MLEFFKTPWFAGLLSGLAIGLVATLWVWISSLFRRSEQRKEMGARLQSVTDEVEKLRQHLHTQMEITAKGTEDQQKQLAEAKSQNENLRILVQTLQQKPENSRARTLEVYQRAIERMQVQAPGFPAAWHQAVTEAENEIAEAEGGLSRFVRKFLGGGKSANPAAPAALPESGAKETPDA